MNKRPHFARLTTQLALAVAAGILACAVQAGFAQACGDVTTGTTRHAAVDQSLATFSCRIENILYQSARGRSELKSAIGSVFSCSSSPAVAASRVAYVVRNRQSLLGQLSTLPRPSGQAAQIAYLLQSSLSHSIAADLHYVDWLGYLQRSGRYCSTAWNPDLGAAQREDAMAGAAKQSFTYAFNPVAAQLHLTTWSVLDF